MATKQSVSLHSYPRFLLLCLLQQFLHLAHAERNIKDRCRSQSRVMSILNSKVVDREVCVGTKLMMWIEYCLRGMKGRELNRTDGQFSGVLGEFRTARIEEFDAFLDDYSEYCRLAKDLTTIFKAFKK
jgi:hypothetical protein